ncbi:alpha-glucosidase [Moellerella wisconsensis]|uniref:Alpha-glucosidase n=1 Tax=Moellerella wisconsensis TaxID=158849 RepID=A0A9Q8PY66_9GAMM|nr:alpha-glucosidase [Moellerella wisconsensis]UNH29379.1 alpha-glucosidase [Moellerella wisconsensis]
MDIGSDNGWWKKAIVYQIYPKSFYDSNHDGIGDLPGITQKLDYIQSLGINVIWLCPIFKSPMKDNGYDIADYYQVDPTFGTNQDLEQLIDEAKKRGIAIMLDLVLNHTSDQHPWFQAAINDPDSPYANYYIFKHWNKDLPPNNLRTYFDTSVWTRLANSDRWYFHSFAAEQPDLNWENPALRQEIINIINYWIEKGVRGFRIDAIGNIKKSALALSAHHFEPDHEDGSALLVPWVLNQPGIADFLNELADNTFKPANSMTVAEIDIPAEAMEEYIGKDGFFSMVFDFSYADADIHGQKLFNTTVLSTKQLRQLVFKSQLELEQVGWAAPYLENHDQPRSLNKFLPKGEINYESTTMLATFYMLLRGTPYIYQGQELGMTNCPMTIDEYDDLAAKNLYCLGKKLGYSESKIIGYLNQRSRDNSRTPFQWDETKNAGFSTHTPWLKVNPNNAIINLKAQQHDPNSVVNYYKKLINLRNNEMIGDILTYGSFVPLNIDSDDVIAYQRKFAGKSVNIVTNFSKNILPLPLKCHHLFLSNRELITNEKGEILLQPYQALVFNESVINNK